MTKAQIKAELRRSACKDVGRYAINSIAFETAVDFCWADMRFVSELSGDDWRTFYLLVAEAL